MDEEEIARALDESDIDSEFEFEYDSDVDPEYLPSGNSARVPTHPDVSDESSDFEDISQVPRVSPQSNETNEQSSCWTVDDGVRNDFVFNNDNVGVNPDTVETMKGCHPIEFFYLFFDEEIVQDIVRETNCFGEREATKDHSNSSRHTKWVATSEHEMKVFFGIVLWMGLVKLPLLSSY